MTIFYKIISALWTIRLIVNLLSFIHLWYVKEYRVDRMIIHLSTEQGKRLLFLPWRRPPVTPKSLFIAAGSLALCMWLYTLLPYNVIVKLFILDIALFPVTALFVGLFKIPTQIYHMIIIQKAVTKLRAHKKMIVIGVTGSYGKTSTKEILFTLLSQKYATLKTEASKNSPIAIAELILAKLDSHYEVLIVEMGAYKAGEIARMCSMVHPDIGIVTAINAQHQDLFGSLENTVKAKYELIRGLSGRNVAIFNYDNTYTRKMADNAKQEGHKVVLYTTQTEDRNKDTYFRASDMKMTDGGITFTMHYASQKGTVSVPLLGQHHVSNILAAIAGAVNAGMGFEEAIFACKHLRPFDKTMQRLEGPHGETYIDDTFNNNPDAAKAAINYLFTARGRKILVFQPMIELGAYAHPSHKEVGALAGKYCDEIILTNNNYYESFIEGVHAVDPNKTVHVFSDKEAISFIKKTGKKGDMVLFKGKEAGRILKNI